MTLYYLSRARFLLSVRALFFVIPCFRFIQFHTFMPESCPVQPQTPTVGHSAASLKHYSITPPSLLPHQWAFNQCRFLFFKNHLVHIETCEVVIRQAAAALYWAHCALRIHRVTVHHDSSSISWKSVLHLGA